MLCVAMMLSVMVMSTGATSFSDEDEFSPQYKEAAEVLTGMGVMQGYEDGSYFLPQRNITRAQVATLIYRAATSDVEDDQTGLFTDWKQFDDVHADDWFAGYVNYCGNAELIKGFTPDTFGPNKNVTGYQVLAMILRAVGYDANDEFTGTGWEIRTASTAKGIGLLKNVQDTTLGQPATRELVAELIFQALNAKMVKYTPALGYVTLDKTLGTQEFNLENKGADNDDWGRPGTLWTYKTGETLVKEAALATYETAVTECDVAEAVELEKAVQVDTYTNGHYVKNGESIRPLATKDTLGAQGQQMELYDADGNGVVDTIVYIDTYLAKVTNVKDATFDDAGHVKTEAQITLQVYDNATGTKVVMKNGGTDYDYTEGQMLLVNAFASKDGKSIDNSKDVVILDVAESIVGTQTVDYINSDRHQVDGETYYDAVQFKHDEADKDGDRNYTWYFDQYGNLIGSTEIPDTVTYGVITRIWWSGDPTDGSGKALANVTYTDGTTGQVVIGDMTYNKGTAGNAYDAANGEPVYSTAADSVMAVNKAGKFEVATDYKVNASAANNGIVLDNLFQFTAKSDGTVAAVEVSGIGTGDYADLYDAKMSIQANTAEQSKSLLIDANTQILIYNPTAETFSVVTGYRDLAAYKNVSVDWANTDNDKAADVVYITGKAVGTPVDKLFYFDGGEGAYSYGDGVWTINGYIDGEEGQIMIEGDRDNTMAKTLTKEADQLFAVEITNGFVTKVYNNAALANTNELPVIMTNNNSIYEKNYDGTVKVYIVEGKDGYKVENGVLYADKQYDIDENVKEIGEALAGDMSDKDMILVVNMTNTSSGPFTILQSYIVDKDADPPKTETTYKVDFEGTTVNVDADANTLSIGGVKISSSDNSPIEKESVTFAVNVLSYVNGDWKTVATGSHDYPSANQSSEWTVGSADIELNNALQDGTYNVKITITVDGEAHDYSIQLKVPTT